MKDTTSSIDHGVHHGTDSSRDASVKIVEFLIGVVLITALIYVYWFNTYLSLTIITTILAVAVVIGYAVKRYQQAPPVEMNNSEISKLILLNEAGESIKEWYIQKETSLLIGKSSLQHEVDIDLSDTEYAALISKQHAVLNQASGDWYIEDVDSRNGIGIKKANTNQRSKLATNKPYKLGSGDTIYIANTKIMLK